MNFLILASILLVCVNYGFCITCKTENECTIDEAAQPCMMDLLPELSVFINDMNESLYTRVHKIIPPSNYPSLTSLGPVLDRGIKKAQNLVDATGKATNQTYVPMFLEMYCGLSEKLFNQMVQESIVIIDDYNKNRGSAPEADKTAITEVINAKKQECVDKRKEMFDKAMDCMECNAWYRDFAKVTNGIGTLCLFEGWMEPIFNAQQKTCFITKPLTGWVFSPIANNFFNSAS